MNVELINAEVTLESLTHESIILITLKSSLRRAFLAIRRKNWNQKRGIKTPRYIYSDNDKLKYSFEAADDNLQYKLTLIMIIQS